MIISITPEIALDENTPFAGGLGVLAADKFYTCARNSIDYVVITPFYNSGYIKYDFVNDKVLVLPDQFPQDFLVKLKEVGREQIYLRKEKVEISFYEYAINNAKVIFVKVLKPAWASRLFNRLYEHLDQSFSFYKYLLFAKAALAYIEKYIGFEKVEYIDLEEAYTAFIPLLLVSKNLKLNCRFVIHTPGPWGHPRFDKNLFAEEFGYNFIEDNIYLTNIASSLAQEIITVSKKHFEISKKMFPHHIYKLKYVTNGVDIKRWMDEELLEIYLNDELTINKLREIKEKNKSILYDFLKQFKEINPNSMFVAWNRRTVAYKRPDFIIKFIKENEENVTFILAGKTDPMDEVGLEFMEEMRRLSNTRNNVIYIWNYNISVAKLIFKGVDLILFTPFSGWEACGTSIMKAGINGIPALSSKDGSAIELIQDNYNGWLFGKDLNELVLFNSEKGYKISEEDYKEFSEKFKNIISLWCNNREKYLEICLNAIKTFLPFASSNRMLSQYYPNYKEKFIAEIIKLFKEK
jgi:Glucan phosphorylase